MSAKSKHHGDVANWIVDVINSCNHPLQEIVAKRLVKQFRVEYCNIDAIVFIALSMKLQNALDAKVYQQKTTE